MATGSILWCCVCCVYIFTVFSILLYSVVEVSSSHYLSNVQIVEHSNCIGEMRKWDPETAREEGRERE